jgi:ParB-like chromosome segregation protein Spo0J
MTKAEEIEGVDVALAQLQPLNQRKPSERAFRRLVASIRELGLIEPLCVYRAGDRFVILDGYLRYLACLELGVEAAPCLVYKNKEAYSFNRMVNNLSPVQEVRMLRKSLETLDQKTIARTLGLKDLGSRLKGRLMSRLHPSVMRELDAGRLMQTCAEVLTYVKPQRQLVILREMQRSGDQSPAFARALIIRTPPALRAKLSPTRKNPWTNEEKKKQLLNRLTEVERRYDFYAALYRQYVADLLKLSIYVRKLSGAGLSRMRTPRLVPV